MKLFFMVVIATCSFAVNACSAKNKFDFKDKNNPTNLYDEAINKYTEKNYARFMKTLDETYTGLTAEINFDSFEEGARIVLDDLLKSARTRIEKLAEKDDLGKECAEKYSVELEAAEVNARKDLRECIASALQQALETEAENRPILDKFARLTKEVKGLVGSCWASGETPREASECIVAKKDEINDNNRKMSNMLKAFYLPLKKRFNDANDELNESFEDVVANFRKKILIITRKAEQCFATE